MRPNSHGDVTVTCANLYGRDEKALLEPLVYARVTRINMGVQLVGFELQGRGGAKSRVERYQQSWLCAAKAEELEALVKLIKEPSEPEYGIDAHENPEAFLKDQAYIDSLFAPGAR
jgi:hypothetical protein